MLSWQSTAPAVMSRIMTPNAETNSAANSSASTSGCGPIASGTRISGAGKTTRPRITAGPMPIRRLIGPVIAAPSSPPNAPTRGRAGKSGRAGHRWWPHRRVKKVPRLFRRAGKAEQQQASAERERSAAALAAAAGTDQEREITRHSPRQRGHPGSPL